MSVKQKESPYGIDINAEIDVESMEEAVKLLYADAYFERGVYLWQLGRYAQALKSFTGAVSLNPKLSEKIQ